MNVKNRFLSFLIYFSSIVATILPQNSPHLLHSKISHIEKKIKSFKDRILLYKQCLRGKCTKDEKDTVLQSAITDGLILISIVGILVTGYYFYPSKKKTVINPYLGKPINEINEEMYKYILYSYPPTKDTLQKFLEAGANINYQNVEGNTFIHFLVDTPMYLDALEFLLEKGANPNIKNKAGETPIYSAVRAGQPHIVQILLNKGAWTVTSLESFRGARETPLRAAERLYESTTKKYNALKKAGFSPETLPGYVDPKKYDEIIEILKNYKG